MREVRESIELAVPVSQAEQCILRYFDRHRTGAGGIEIPLHVPLAGFGVPGNLKLERQVTVHVSKRRDAQNLNDEIAMRWEPGEGEPFPSFAGRIITWSETTDKTQIELRGNYEPPLGAVGKAFDDAVGHLIAKQTARQFLSALAEGAQACFHQ